MTLSQGDWPRCRDWIAASAAYSPLPETIEEIEGKLEAEEYQFWPGENSAAVTEIATYQGRKAMIVRYAGGDLSEILGKIEPALCEVAKRVGCTVMIGEGRHGWKRASEPNGYRFAWLTMFKEI